MRTNYVGIYIRSWVALRSMPARALLVAVRSLDHRRMLLPRSSHDGLPGRTVTMPRTLFSLTMAGGCSKQFLRSVRTHQLH